MARGPYQGTYQPNSRPTVVTAPDALVYINGEADVIGCPQCNRFFDFNKFITSVQVDLNVDSVPGSASINLSIPRHTVDDFYFDGNPIISPMMEIEIFSKGYYLVEGVPQYYPIFWGVVTEVSDSYSGGEHTVTVHCADILKWWDICKMNINAAWTAPVGQQGRSIFGNVYFGTNPYDIIWSLALQSYGDVIVGTGSLVSTVRETAQRPVFNAALSDLMLYWEKRFSRIRSSLMLYGVNGVAVRGDSLSQHYSKKSKGEPGQPFASAAVRNANGGEDGGQMVFDTTDPKVTAYRTQFSNAGQVNMWQSEYQTKLELALAAKEALGFEFYMDVDGSIVFKPPFYNLDVLGNKPLSWIQDIDIIDWDFSESEAEVVTQIVMQGSFGGNVDYGLGEETTPFTSVTDYHLLRKYGWRSHPYSSEFLGDTQLMFYHGLDVLDRINSKRHRGTVTIPHRPELRLGFPIYIAPKDQIWYVSGISHNIAFGSRATTTLTLTAKRSKHIAIKGIGSLNLKSYKGEVVSAPVAGSDPTFKYTSRQLSRNGTFELKMGAAGTLPPDPDQVVAGADNPYDPLLLRHPKTGRIVGYPNVVMVYTRPFSPADKDIADRVAGKTKTNPNVAKDQAKKLENNAAQTAGEIDRFLTTNADRLREKHLTNRYQYGLNSAGVYVYAHDGGEGGKNPKGVIGEMLLLPSKNLIVTPELSSEHKLFRSQSALIRPVSDERGFEVVGHFRYGRRVALRDGRLILTGTLNNAANVDTQLALSGGLFETLNAQSQGLTSISTAYLNPASTISSLQPEDLQTAAAYLPDTQTPAYTDVGDNFVDSAPLGSVEQKGVPTSVEASQLSKALTLAEMSVKMAKEQQDDADCPCVTGRADLAFINLGYQVKTISSSSPDASSLFATPSDQGTVFENTAAVTAEALGGPVSVGDQSRLQRNLSTLQALQAQNQEQIAIAKERLDALQSSNNSKTQQGATAIKAAAQELAKLQETDARFPSQIADIEKQITTMEGQSTGSNGSAFAGTPKALISRVDAFLTNLYIALDTPHQKHEGELRGDYMPGGPLSSTPNADSSFGTPNPSQFAPPFSAPNRFELGDPEALAGSVRTNAHNISKTWDDFGKKLRSSTTRTKLEREIQKDTGDIARLIERKEKLENASKYTFTGFTDRKAEIADLDSQIQKLEQEVAHHQLKLSQLPTA